MRNKIILIILLAITVVFSFSIVAVANSKKTFSHSDLIKYANVYIKFESERSQNYDLAVATNNKGKEIKWGTVKLRADIYEAMDEFSNKSKKEIYFLAFEKIKSESEEETLLMKYGQQISDEEVKARINNIKEILKGVPENDNQINLFINMTKIDEEYYWNVIKFDEEYRFLTHLEANELKTKMRISDISSDTRFKVNSKFMELTNEN